MIELATFSGPDDWQIFQCRLATLAAPNDWQLFQCRWATLAAPYDWQLFQCHMIGDSCIAMPSSWSNVTVFVSGWEANCFTLSNSQVFHKKWNVTVKVNATKSDHWMNDI